jgi:hypothetical protein
VDYRNFGWSNKIVLSTAVLSALFSFLFSVSSTVLLLRMVKMMKKKKLLFRYRTRILD